MEKFVKGEVVIIPFPFSDLTVIKKRPALILSNLQGKDLILCQITSQAVFDNYAIPLSKEDFEDNALNQHSNIRPNRIFTAEKSIVSYSIGGIKKIKTQEVIDKVIEIFQK